MELSLIEQAVTQLKQSKSLVIIIPEQPSADALAAALALLAALEKGQHNVRVVCPKFSPTTHHGFLPKINVVSPDLTALRDFVITVNIAKTKPDALRYHIKEDTLEIFVTPKKGFFEPTDVKSSGGTFVYDTIVTLDVTSLNQLGPLYHENAEFFYHTPIINIDHHGGNTRFGHINLIDLTATCVSETIFELIKNLDAEWLDEHIATSLLTGIISKTKAFQSRAVTPRSLAIASHLMAAGARRDEIISHLYRTKNIPTLQLWGRALAKIKASPDGRIVWSTVTLEDLKATKSQPIAAAGVLDELMINTPQAEYSCLLVEDEKMINLFVHSQQPLTRTLPLPLHQESTHFARGQFAKPLSAAEDWLLSALAQ